MADASKTPKQRIGLVLAGLGDANVNALRYLILQMNGLQATFEYEFLPWSQDDFLTQLEVPVPLDRQNVRAQAPLFAERYRVFLAAENDTYSLKEPPPNYFVIISLARFSDEFYSTRKGQVSVLALGNWARFMAPPSILEFILTLIVREAVASISQKLRGSVHLGTKGCVCDFTPSLDEVRIKVLSVFLCAHCSQALVSDGYPSVPGEVRRVLEKRWLGKDHDPSSPAAIISKLGYNLFVTKGLKATAWEKGLATLREEGVKQLVTIVASVIGAGLLLWLGLKAA